LQIKQAKHEHPPNLRDSAYYSMMQLPLEFIPPLFGICFYVLHKWLSIHVFQPAAKDVKQSQMQEPQEEREITFTENEPEPEDRVVAKAPESLKTKKMVTQVVCCALLATLSGLFVVWFANSSSSPVEFSEPVEDLFSEPVEDLLIQNQFQESMIHGPETPPTPMRMMTLNLTRQQMQYPHKGVMYYKTAYWGRIHLGHPGQDFKVVFDTGSGHLILPSTYCSSETCRVHKRYKRSKSETATDIDWDGSRVQPGMPRDQLTVSFGTGEITGVFVDDVVCIADDGHKSNRLLDPAILNPVTKSPGCMNMRVIMATEMTAEPFKSFHFDGILGMGLAALAQTPEFNLIHMISQNMGDWGGTNPGMFSVFLADRPYETSAITLGGYPTNRHQGPISWSAVHKPELGHWLIKVYALKVNGVALDYCEEGCKAVVDTGTSLLSVPSPAFPELFEKLRHEVSESVSCTGPGPVLELDLGGHSIVLTPSNYARVESVKPTYRKWGEERNSAKSLYCKPTMMAMNLPAPLGPKLFILGEPVLRKYFTVYDAERKAVGFSLAIHEGPTQLSQQDQEDESWFFDDE